MKKLCLLLASVVVLGSCKKNDDNSPSAAPTRTSLLTAKNWRLSTVTVTLNGIAVPSSLFLADCDKDDFYKFNTDKTMVADAGPTKCSASDPQTESGTWKFSNSDETKLTIALPNSALNGDADIKELSATTLHLYSSQSASGTAYTFDATFVPN